MTICLVVRSHFVAYRWFSTRQATSGDKQVTVSAQKLRVAINGFGRIGRNFLRCWHLRKQSNLEVVVINDSGGVKQVGSWKQRFTGFRLLLLAG
jgi:glutamate dehydrogenase/leucine dehydrogenase